MTTLNLTNYFPYNITLDNLREYARTDEVQLEALAYLSEVRGIEQERLADRGIVFIDNLDELYYLAEQYDIEDLACMGINEDNIHLYLEGYLVPVTDIQGRIIYYINYNPTRDKATKYIMALSGFVHNDFLIRFYGLDNFNLALKYDSVAIVEGLFDSIRLLKEGIPAFATLGTKLNDYQKLMLSRFKTVVHVPDNDVSGEIMYKHYSKNLNNIIKFEANPEYEDVDDFGKSGGKRFEKWTKQLKLLMNIHD